MSVAASRPSTPVVVTASLPAPTPADREPAPHPFAQLLRQSRGVERPAVEAAKPGTAESATPRAEPGPEPATASDESVPTNDSAAKSEAGGRARARADATSARSAARAAGTAERPSRGPEQSVERGAQDDDRAPADASSMAANPAFAVRPDAARPVGPELRPGPAASGSPPAASGGRDAEAVAAPIVALDAGAPADRTEARRGGVSPADTDRGGVRAPDGDAATPAASFRQIFADAKAADPAAAASVKAETPPPAATPTAIPIAAHEPQPPARVESAPAAQAATFPVPVDSPEFAAALGVQVSVFVRDGVQQAELHLNPVETGPVSIAISLEGSQARVEFGADLAATRQAIENGLPALASALRDAGFTLAGGGVAQHARSGSGGAGGDHPSGRDRPERGANRGGEAIASPAAVQRASHRLAAGGIDLYA